MKRMSIHKLRTPLSEETVRKLGVNDTVYLSGTIVTVRDAAHRRALDFHKEGKQLPVNLEGLAVFHCGPLVKKEDDNWRVVAAGPTTSARMDLFEGEFIKNFKVRIVVGKGGMGKKTVDAMKKYGAVYGAFTGGAGVLAAKAIKQVKDVEWSDLGMPEAMWILEVEDFGPLTVAIDAHGNNLFETIQTKADTEKQKIYNKLHLK
jgi:fumarate hydratase subunit beta